MVTEAGDTSLSDKQLLTEMEYREYKEHYKNALSNLPAIKDGNFSIDTKFISLTL